MESSIFKFTIRHSKRQQLILLAVTLVSLPFVYYSMDLPKIIINKAIGSNDFPRQLFGAELQQTEYLLTMCLMFLFLVLINGGFKYWLNVYRGQLGEQMLRRLRYLLYSRVLRFPLAHFRKLSQGEIISMITAEVEPLGGFIGDAFVLPAYQGGILLTILLFMFNQDPVLGGAAIALYPLQMYLIPKMQRRVNDLSKQRVKAVRGLSENIGESVSGIQEVHAHDTSELERANFSRMLGVIFTIRYDIYRRKFFIKFLNNFIANVTPFFFYSIGGYLVIAGDLSFGSLVAVLAAYKDLASPWKELLRYYQQKEDAGIKYEQLVDQFQPSDMLEEALQQIEPDEIPNLGGAMVATNLTLEETGGINVVDGVSFNFDISSHTAVVGTDGAGKAALARIMARLAVPSAGSISIDDNNLANLSEAVTGQRISYVGQNSYIFSGTVRDNFFYGLKHRPLHDPDHGEQANLLRQQFVRDAKTSGNTTSDPHDDWIDYQVAGVSSSEELAAQAAKVLEIVNLKNDIYELGLQGRIDPDKYPDLSSQIFEARLVFGDRLRKTDLAKLIEPFDRNVYNMNMSVAENLLFGTLIGNGFNINELGENAYVVSVLEKVGLREDFLAIGFKLASIMIELFQGLAPGHEYFERYSFISAEELPEYQHCVIRAETDGLKKLDKESCDMFVSLPFKIIPARHRLGLIDDDIQGKILEARHAFAEGLPGELEGSVAFFYQGQYNAAASVQDNILFGRPVYGRHQNWPQIGALIREVVESLGLYDAVLDAGLDTNVGIGGSRLSVAQRQRLSIARCLIKRSDILVIDSAATALDPASQAELMDNIIKESDGRGLIWVLNRPEQARRFDTILVMEGGKIIDKGRFEEISQPGKPFHKMMA